jgi:hypothetical protein
VVINGEQLLLVRRQLASGPLRTATLIAPIAWPFVYL